MAAHVVRWDAEGDFVSTVDEGVTAAWVLPPHSGVGVVDVAEADSACGTARAAATCARGAAFPSSSTSLALDNADIWVSKKPPGNTLAI